jgi:hypothetical protein
MSEIQEIARDVIKVGRSGRPETITGWMKDRTYQLAEQVLADAVTIEGLRETVAHPPDTEALIEKLLTRIVELEFIEADLRQHVDNKRLTIVDLQGCIAKLKEGLGLALFVDKALEVSTEDLAVCAEEQEQQIVKLTTRIAELEAYAVDAAKLLTAEHERANALERLVWPDGRPGAAAGFNDPDKPVSDKSTAKGTSA